MCTYTNCPESGQGKSLGVAMMEISSSFFKSSSQNKELGKEINMSWKDRIIIVL